MMLNLHLHAWSMQPSWDFLFTAGDSDKMEMKDQNVQTNTLEMKDHNTQTEIVQIKDQQMQEESITQQQGIKTRSVAILLHAHNTFSSMHA